MLMLRGLRNFSTNAQLISNLKEKALKGIKEPETLKTISSEAVSSGLKNLSTSEISTLAWSFAQLGEKDLPLFELIASTFPQKKDATAEQVENIAWSLSCLDLLRTPQTRDFFKWNIPATTTTTSLDKERASRLFSTCVDWMLTHPTMELPKLLKNLSGLDLSKAKPSGPVPKVQEEMASVFRTIGFPDAKVNYLTPKGLCADIYLKLNFVFLVDTPKDLLSDGKTPTGPTLQKRRLLQKEGYRVYSGNALGWEKIPPNPSQKEFLRAQKEFLKDSIFPPPPPPPQPPK